MSALIVCRALIQDLPDRRGCEFEALAGRCAQRLKEARRDGRHIVHYFTRWPTDSTALPGCTARASEPLFTGPFSSLLNAAPLRRHLIGAHIHMAELIGLMDARILNATLAKPRAAGLSLKSDPDLIHIVESVRPGSLTA